MRIITALIAGAAASALLTGAAHAQDTVITWKGAPQFTKGDLTFKVRGRVYYDFVSQEVDFADSRADLDTQATRLRTARLGVEGTWHKDWSYVAELSLTGGASTEVNWEDLVLKYSVTDSTAVSLGHFKTISFENLSSSRYNTFMERGPLNDLIGGGRVMAAQVKTGGDNWTAAAFVHGDNLNAADPGLGSSEPFGYGGRVTFSPLLTDTAKVHLGGWARARDHGDGAAPFFNYQARNNTNVGARYVSTGAAGDKDMAYGLEGLLIVGSFSVQSEYANMNFERATGVDHDISTYYVAGSWFLTGETRNLAPKKGVMDRTKIRNPMTAGGLGAIELAVRYDHADLTDAFTQGVAGPPAVAPVSPLAGEYSAVTVGANWHPHSHVRFMLNYTQSDNDLTALAATPTVDPDVDVKTLQLRAQFDF